MKTLPEKRKFVDLAVDVGLKNQFLTELSYRALKFCLFLRHLTFVKQILNKAY